MAISTIGTNGLDQTNNIELGATGGYVGIGTASPRAPLAISSSSGSTAGVPGKIRLYDDGASNIYGFGISTGQLDITAGTSGNIAFYTNGANERMRIDSSGNVGIGTSSPSSVLDVKASLSQIKNTSTTGTNTVQYLASNTGGNFYTALDSSTGSSFGSAYAAVLWHSGNYPMLFATNNTERMRIDSSGNVLVGTTVLPDGSNNGTAIRNTQNGACRFSGSGTTSRSILVFYNSNGLVGQISTSGSSTTYATSSDYRLKEKIVPMVGALDTVAQLKPVTYNWKTDGSKGQGFIAHELQAVVPDCVTGEKDAVDADGNPVYQGVDTSFLVATLTAAIQEQQELIKQLQADVAKLKGAKA